MWSSIILYIISNKYSSLFEGKYAHRWLFLRVVPRVFRPVICRDNLKIRKILRMRKICAALAMYSREYWEDRRLRKTETKKGKIPRRSIILRNEMMNSNCKWGKNLWKRKPKNVSYLVRGHNEPYKIFQRKPSYKDSLGDSEEIVFFFYSLGRHSVVL